jgi:6-phosphogluconolactonase
MRAEENIEANAEAYERGMAAVLGERPLDLVMLGMGDDGHTASLFPETEGLHVLNRRVIANFVPEKKIWRMSFTFEWINAAQRAVIYVLGAAKKFTLAKALLNSFQQFPVLKVGTAVRPALFIADEAAAAELIVEKEKRTRKP